MSEKKKFLIERRQAGRIYDKIRVIYKNVDVMMSEFTRDLNERGMFIQTSKPYPLFTTVELEFCLPGTNYVIKTTGEVQRSVRPEESIKLGESAGMYIEFKDISPDDKAKINEIIRLRKSAD